MKYVCFNLLILIYSVKLCVMTHITMEDNNANLPSSVRHDNHLHTIIKGKSLLFIHHKIIIQQIIVYLTRHGLSNYLLHYHCQIHSHLTQLFVIIEIFVIINEKNFCTMSTYIFIILISILIHFAEQNI